MARRGNTAETATLALEAAMRMVRTPSEVAAAVARCLADAGALRFHLTDSRQWPRVVVVLGGTGTGKSTLVNRLAGTIVCAASVRRTFTAGPVAVARDEASIAAGLLGIEHRITPPEELPARGQADRLEVVFLPGNGLLARATLIDTPDLDGDQPLHHAQADRAFRWAHAVLFLVTPEKYQMTELLPYYRLSARYAVPALYAMNKAESAAVVSDYERQLAAGLALGAPGAGGAAPVKVFAVPRDDAAFEPPPDAGLDALRNALSSAPVLDDVAARRGVSLRKSDLIGRVRDQVIAPLRDARRDADRLIAALRAMETPPAGVDVNPLTRQLQRRLQQRSILYLMGPQRVLDRVRQVPGLLVRLPRTAWDLLRSGRAELGGDDPANGADARGVPDFAEALVEQLAVVQSRVDDVVRGSPAGERWALSDAAGYAARRITSDEAAAIAQEELADLRTWLEQRWNATPRDTALLERLIRHLPGGQRLTRWTEAAPYLLTIVVATHHAFFGHVDLMILGGYTLATWLTERVSDEVAARTRLTNRRIAERFARLAHEQIERSCAWLDGQAPPADAIERLARAADDLEETET